MLKQVPEEDLFKPLSEDQKREILALLDLPDSEIDTSDIPELPESVWRERGVRGLFYRPIKKPVTMARPGCRSSSARRPSRTIV